MQCCFCSPGHTDARRVTTSEKGKIQFDNGTAPVCPEAGKRYKQTLSQKILNTSMECDHIDAILIMAPDVD